MDMRKNWIAKTYNPFEFTGKHIADFEKKGYNASSAVNNNGFSSLSNSYQTAKTVFDNDAFLNSALDFLYLDKNQGKTRSFLENNDFPSIEDRKYDKEYYGVKEENKRLLDLFKTKTNNIINPKLPDKTDRLFLSGFLGDEEEERNYQKQVADSKKAKTELYNVFRGTPFESIFAPKSAETTGMPLKKQDPVAELMEKYEQYKKSTEGTTASKSGSAITQYAKKETSYPGKTSLGSKKEETPVFAKSPKETVEEIWENAKETAKEIWGNSKDTAINLLNDASAWANEKGVFDDVTNAFFKAADLSQDYPLKRLPTDHVHQAIAIANYIANQKIDLSGYEADGGYINDQNAPGSQSGKIRYGSGTFKGNGCEIIAVNNALVSLGNRKDVRKIAMDFETNGQTLFGAFGTSPFAIDDYFKKQGYKVKTFTGDKKIYNLDIPDADTYIVSFWNSDKVTDMIHTISVDKLPNGKYKLYNAKGDTPIEIDSLNEYFLESNRVPLVLHCIKKGR